MKVVWVSHSDTLMGGAEFVLWEGVRALSGRGVEVHVVVPARGALSERLESAGFAVSVFPYYWWVSTGGSVAYRVKQLAGQVGAWRRMAKFLRRLGPDVVLTNTLTVCAGAFAARWSDTPHVWYVHELFGRDSHNLHFDFGDRPSLSLMNRLSELVITTSPVVQGVLQKWMPADKIRQVYCAVETAEQQARPGTEKSGGALELIQVGLMSQGKRQEEAVRAVALLGDRGLDVRLTLVGSEQPQYGAFLRRLAAELGVEGRVRFVPFTDDVAGRVAAADVALLCSRGEAFGRVTVEAMKLGKPVVGANSGGTATLVKPGANGFLYEPGDVEDLARKIEILYHDRALVAALGAEARRWSAETFNLDKFGRELHDVLAHAAAAGRGGGAAASDRAFRE